MVILTIQFGQCGNQVGHSLFTYLVNDIKYNSNSVTRPYNDEYSNLATSQWFSASKQNYLMPRSILVDTENKVISSIVRQKDLLKYQNIIAKSEGGSANNWAYGYGIKGKTIKNEVVDLVRKEIEKCDEIIQIFNILSSGGGTGSGVGSNVIEHIRDELPNKTIVNVIVLPYNNGEVVTQSYNTLLTLGKLYDLTDGSILFENDLLHKVCKELLAVKNVDLKHINSVIGQKIAAVFQPLEENPLSSFVSHLTSHPSYKFVQIKTTPHISEDYRIYESKQGWPILIGHVRNTLRLNNHWETKGFMSCRSYPATVSQSCKSVGSLLITRGGASPEAKMLEPLVEESLYARWLPKEDRLKHFHQPRNLYNTANFLALATNNNSVCKTIENTIEQAWTLFNHKAYLHQYQKYGINEDEFNVAFEKMESVLHNYDIL